MDSCVFYIYIHVGSWPLAAGHLLEMVRYDGMMNHGVFLHSEGVDRPQLSGKRPDEIHWDLPSLKLI